MRLAFVAAGLALMVACFPAFGQFEGEVLWATAPSGYKIDYHAKNDDIAITELVPKKQSVKNWTEMVTIQVFYGLKSSPEQFMAKIEKLATEACPGASVILIRQGEENGYPFNLFLQDCPLNKATGKPEITWFKTIEGKDSFCVVQFATKLKPTEEKITKWMQYLRSVIVCDTRLPDRPCSPVSGGAKGIMP
jgi:hypothetical protein